MKTSFSISRSVAALLAVTLLCGIAAPEVGFAKQGATDPIPGTSNGATNSGGGGSTSTTSSGGANSGGVNSGGANSGGSKTVVTSPTPAPAPQPIVTAALTFTAAASVNGVVPVCTGSYHIDPYYPTLSLLTVSVQSSSMNVADGTQLYVAVNGANGTLYPVTTNIMTIAGQSGSCTLSAYITLGTTISSVMITDASGTVIAAGH